ncbi:hypothetical protein NQ315_014984 [Exocentrus adspersus]|uniref:EB domain-containing protein n=1 Tax=Exocentrus adspersus TaxID=1586481 RepID=A0AAV8VXH5_9CUCU|nr:hypothetical protein NQ315_014984 [Exocentrus adspersus]
MAKCTAKGQAVLDEIFKIRYCNTPQSPHPYSKSWGCAPSRGDFAPAYRPTPATVRVVTALLGDLCSDNRDCMILYSHCVKGACTCLPNYSISSDRQECIAQTTYNN